MQQNNGLVRLVDIDAIAQSPKDLDKTIEAMSKWVTYNRRSYKFVPVHEVRTRLEMLLKALLTYDSREAREEQEALHHEVVGALQQLESDEVSRWLGR